MEAIIQRLAQEFSVPAKHVENVINLLDEGNTVPFIARYRKEMHGGMDDQLIRQLADRLQYLRGLDKRRQEVKTAIENQGKLTDELAQAIDAAQTLAEVEDLYRPYQQKRRTRATMAKEKGLEPLAQTLYDQKRDCPAPETLAQDFINPDLGVEDVAAALQGASDIVAEWISDDADIRKTLRTLYGKKAMLVSKAAAKEPEDTVYRLYYEFSAPVSKVMGHQVLAINRGEREDILKVSVDMDEEEALVAVRRQVVRPGTSAMAFVKAAAEDAYRRLIAPSLEREVRSDLTEKASEGAIGQFALNLKPLLMQPPVKGHVTMGLDPGYRMGCKVAVIDPTGKVLDTTVVYPTHGERGKQEAIAKLSALVKKHHVQHIAIGNGTASRETEQMAVEMIGKLNCGVTYMMVNEAGASVYSASKLAAEEFPDFDVNLRSAVSIARRLQDPLAELVKIDPKSIGVGQYQHDMPQARLGEALDGVVEDCVNAVGVDVNTASAPLLARVAGLTQTTAKNMVKYREENGPFTTRKQILKVPKLGPKAFEQCAGFLRVPESNSPLDNTAVHPESYAAAQKLLELCGYTLEQVKAGTLQDLMDKVKAYGVERAAEACGVGVPTLLDVASELMKPGRDPRDELPAPVLRTDVLEIKDLKPGMELKGTVRNVIDFGAFVDIGVHQDGLVHISQICDRFIKHPSQVLSVGDVVTVWVKEVDEKKKRISLTMKGAAAATPGK
ncbi:RNA-binding transcriptional accessory protein [Pseudoflavonifractor sp. An44]|uniref:Tex family protein n=1 Tax=Pseudoflavonifractor sp. An44 TaxID=1965635 RepID=UPI000B384BE3|nr:Tex family protein [Pseudoflavonifractor sp. An44]OUN98575.1 RNA-binding transcriptional accessory protein [Pseudoflavonifractor sp. An44]